MFPVPPPNFQRLNTNAREQFLHDITNNNHEQNVHPNNNSKTSDLGIALRIFDYPPKEMYTPNNSKTSDLGWSIDQLVDRLIVWSCRPLTNSFIHVFRWAQITHGT